MPQLFNEYTGLLLLISVPLKAVCQYLHVKTYGGNPRRVTDYAFILPVLDDHSSIYKYCANTLVCYQYSMIGIALYQNRAALSHIWQMWDRMP
jgi:hypothetical protein